MKNKKGSIQTWKDLGIAAGVTALALTVMSLILMPAASYALSGMMYNTCCDKMEDLPEESVVWLCQYLTYYTPNGTIRIDLNSDESWSKHGELINNLTGLENKEEWTIFCIDMLNKEPYVENYLLEQGFYIISCVDCEGFKDLANTAIEYDRPVKIVMYDCCCNICPLIVPIFIY